MAIYQETKNKIIDLYFKEHLPIREIARITKKSSRDIILVLRTQEKVEEDGKIDSNTQESRVQNVMTLKKRKGFTVKKNL
jgi:hypothetical protein